MQQIKKRNPVPSPRGEVFHFIFHFHYLSGESINARRIREITWALAFPGLVLILLSAHLSLPLCLFFIRCSPTFFALLPLFTHHLSHFSVLFSLLCLSLSISGCHRHSVAFFTSLPCDIPLFLFLRPLSQFLAMPLLLFSFFLSCVALNIPLALPTGLTLDQHDWTWPPRVLLSGWSSAKKEVS